MFVKGIKEWALSHFCLDQRTHEAANPSPQGKVKSTNLALLYFIAFHIYY